MNHSLSQKALDIVHYALASIDRQQKRIVRKNANKLCEKNKYKLEFQYGMYEDMNVISFAAEKGHQFLFEVLLECCKVDPKIAHAKRQTTALHHAAASGQIGMIDTLVTRYECPLDHADRCGSTALYHAIFAGKTDAIIRLVNLGASLEVENFFGSPLHAAALYGDHVAVQSLHVTRPEIVNLEVHGFCTPLLAAIRGQSPQCVDYLAQFADMGGQPLAYKVLCCYSTEELAVKCLQYLLQRGMDPNLRDEALLEDIPVVHAAKLGWRKVVEILLPRTKDTLGLPSTVDGLMEHVGSEKFRLMDQGRKETRAANLRTRFLDELTNRRYLTTNYIIRILRMEGQNVEYLMHLYQTLVKNALSNVYTDCDDESIRSYGYLALQLGVQEAALRAAKACMTLDHHNENNKRFCL